MGSLLKGPGDEVESSEVYGGVPIPVNEEGEPYRYCMVMPNGEDLLYADGFDDMLDGLMPGYLVLTDEVERAMHRIKLGNSVATVVQAEMLVEADPANITEEDWAVLTAPRVGPDTVRADWWMSPVPLIVLETSYEPYTDRPRPASGLSDGVVADNLWWIRPSEEEDFLISLHEVGYIRIMENMDIESEV